MVQYIQLQFKKATYYHNFLILILFSTYFLQSSLFAQDLMDMSIEELMNVRITTSAKTEQEQWQASAKIVVITEKMISERGYQDLVQVLRDAPQFQVQSEYGHWTKGAIVNLRGHRSGDSGNNKFLILVDGIKLSDDAEEGLYLGMNSIPLNSIKQIEIAYGPNSTLYGRDAYAGMINLITKKSEFVNGGVSFGTYNTKRVYAGMHHKFSDNVSMNLLLSNYKSDEQDPTDKSVSYIYRTVFPQKPYTGVFYRASDNSMLNIRLNFYDFSVKYMLYDITGSESYGSSPNYYVTEYSTVAKQKNEVLNLGYKKQISNKFDIKFNVTGKRYEFDPQTANLYTDDLKTPLDSTGGVNQLYAYGGRKYYYFRTKSFKAGLKTVYRPNNKIKLVSGIDYNYVNGIPINSEGQGGDPITTEKQRQALEHKFNTSSVFSELNYQILPWLFTSAGGRIDFNSNYSTTQMPRLALIFKPKQHVVKLLYSRGYLAPSISQKGFESITTFSWIKPNDNLKPEKITSYEVEWAGKFSNFQFFASFFTNKISDGIQESIQTGDSTLVQITDTTFYVPVLQSANGRQGYRYGIHLGASSVFNKHFSLSVDYSWLTGYDKIDGLKIPLYENLVSSQVIKGNLQFNYGIYSLYTGLYWTSERKIRSNHKDYQNLIDKNGFDYFPDVFLTDLNLRANNLYKGLSLYLTVTNLFNEEYYGQTINADWGSPKILQDLRRCTLGLEYEF